MLTVYATIGHACMVPVCALLAEDVVAVQAEPGIGRAALANDLGDYYAGELLSAVVLGGLGAVSAGAGGYLVTRDADFARGLGWPLLTLGGLELIGGIAYGFSVRDEIERYGAAFAQNPSMFRAEERDHIHGTNSRFVVYRSIEFAMAAAGAGMLIYGLASDRDAWKGAGVGTLAVAMPIVVVDTFNSARAGRYEEHLDRFDPSLAVGPAYVGIRARF